VAERAVRPVEIVVMRVLAEHSSGMLRAGDQYSVEEFAADATDETFGDRVPGPRLDDPQVHGG
jgi:hypothetical protein